MYPLHRHTRTTRLTASIRTILALFLLLVLVAACSSGNTAQQVDEGFPTPQPTTDDQTAEEADTTPEAEADEAEAEPATESETDQAEAEAEPATESEPLTDTAAMTETEAVTDTVADEPAPTEPAPTEPAPTEAPTEPIALKAGEFTFIDNAHNATGTATAYQLPDGSRILRLENFEVANAPEIYVLLAIHPEPRNDSELFDQGQVELGALKALSGNQNYDIPADLDLTEYNSVVLYCRPYTTIMSTATIQ